jgi:hypothetical protein
MLLSISGMIERSRHRLLNHEMNMTLVRKFPLPLDREANTLLDHHFQPFLRGVDPVLQLSIFTAVACSIVLEVSARGCYFILSMFKYVVQLCLM